MSLRILSFHLSFITIAFLAMPSSVLAEQGKYFDKLGIPHGSGSERTPSIGRHPIAKQRDVRLGLVTPAELPEILQCVRQLLNESRGGEAGVRMAADLIEDARAEFRAARELHGIRNRCREALRDLPRATLSRERQLAVHASLHRSYSVPTHTLIGKFLQPTVNCVRLGVGVGGGLVLTGRADAYANFYCMSTDGRRWSGIALGAGWGGVPTRARDLDGPGGFGLMLSLHGGVGQSGNLRSIQGAIGVGGDMGFYDGPSGTTGLRDLGVTVGLGASGTSSRERNFRIIPLPNNWNAIIEAHFPRP